MQLFGDAVQGNFKVAVNVVTESFEGRDINDLHTIGQRPLLTPFYQSIDNRIECSQRLATAGGCSY